MTDLPANNDQKFSRIYLIVNEVFNAITHGIGACLSIAGLIFLIFKGADSGSSLEIVSYIIYGSTLILLFLSSTLYHSLIFTKAREIFKKFDHCSIFLLIAGSYTPYTLITVNGALGWTLFAIVWIIAILGVIYKVLWINKYKKYSTLIYIAMGWLSVFALRPIYLGLGFGGFGLLVAGGLAYTLGTIFYGLRKVKFMHVVWHLFVLAGTAFVYFSILFYI